MADVSVIKSSGKMLPQNIFGIPVRAPTFGHVLTAVTTARVIFEP
jgi:hypothetical protein